MKICEINLQNLEENKFLKGDLFWNKKSGKKVLLSPAGTFVDYSFAKKLLDKNESLEMSDQGNFEFQDTLQMIFNKIQNADHELDRVAAREELDLILKKILSKEISIDAIDIVAPCFSAFYKLSEEIENIYFLNNSDLLLREVFIASLLVCMAIEAGYLDYDFLKNVFNTELKINHELAAAKISAYHLEELEKKRIGKIREFSDQSLMYSFTDYAKKASSQINDGSIYEQSLKSLCDTNGEEVSPVSFGDLFLIKSAIEKEISFVGTSLKEIDFSLLLVEILKHKEVTKFYKVISLEKVS